MGAENFSLPGFDPRTVQPIASFYTDFAIPFHTRACKQIIIIIVIIIINALHLINHKILLNESHVTCGLLGIKITYLFDEYNKK
jgi:hypothetical protein